MSKKRDFAPNMCYCLTSRVVNGARYFTPAERSRFVGRMWRAAAFSGMTVLAYCVMPNRYDILVHCPGPEELSDDEILARVRTLYVERHRAEFEDEFASMSADPAGQKAFLKSFLWRMGDVSEFVRTLNHHTTVSFNCRNLHTGTLWEGPFRAVAFHPGDTDALAGAAASIDRGPVDDGLVTWPDAYEGCSFAAACKGDERAIAGYRRIHSPDGPAGWEAIRAAQEEAISVQTRTPPPAFGADGKRGELLERGIEDAEESGEERMPVLLERGKNKVAFGILARLREGPRGPAELRAALRSASPDFFTARYLTPLESAGFIELADGANRFSPIKKFILTEKGQALLLAYENAAKAK